MKSFLFPFITCIDQIIFLEKQLWGTASTITMNISLTKDRSKNIIGASIIHIQQAFEKNSKNRS